MNTHTHTHTHTIDTPHTSHTHPLKKFDEKPSNTHHPKEKMIGSTVTLQGLVSRSDLNGLQAVIKADRGDRYLVSVKKDSGDVEMLRVKKTNVVATPASKIEEMLKQYMGAELVAQMKANVTEVKTRFSRQVRKISPNLTENQALIAIGVLIALFVFFVGFFRSVLLCGIFIYMMFLQIPTVIRTYRPQGMAKMAQAVAQVIGKDFAKRTIWKVSPARATWTNGLMALCALLFVAFRFTASSSSSSSSYSKSSDVLQEAYDAGYRNGWADATDDNSDFGAHRKYIPSDTYSDAYSSSSGTMSSSSSSSSFGIGKMISMGMLGYNAWKLGQTGMGGWDPKLAMERFTHLPTYRKALFAFLLLRLFGLSPI